MDSLIDTYFYIFYCDIDPSCDVSNSTVEGDSYKQLLCAIILQAIDDLTKDLSKYKKTSTHLPTKVHNFTDALNFFDSTWFIQICDMIEYCPIKVKESVLKNPIIQSNIQYAKNFYSNKKRK